MTKAKKNGMANFERQTADGCWCTPSTHLWLGNRRKVRRTDHYPGHCVLARLVDLRALPLVPLRFHVLAVPGRRLGALTGSRLVFLGGHVVDAVLLNDILAVPLDRIGDVRDGVLARLPRIDVGLRDVQVLAAVSSDPRRAEESRFVDARFVVAQGVTLGQRAPRMAQRRHVWIVRARGIDTVVELRELR